MRLPITLLTAPLLLLAGCLQPPGPPGDPLQTMDPSARPHTGGSPDVPSWTVNDHWVLRTYPQGNPDETTSVIDEFVQAIDVLHADGADMDAFRVVSKEANRTTWYRMSDLALMKEETRDAEGPQDVTYERPCAFYQWPLEVDLTWSRHCARIGKGTLNFTAHVEDEEMVSVANGNFSTFKIKFVGTDDDVPFERTEYFAPSACFPVRTIVDGTNGTLVTDLITYQCTSAGAT